MLLVEGKSEYIWGLLYGSLPILDLWKSTISIMQGGNVELLTTPLWGLKCRFYLIFLIIYSKLYFSFKSVEFESGFIHIW